MLSNYISLEIIYENTEKILLPKNVVLENKIKL